uniref:Uncharacterized protein n=1 Tax=Anguilla anguilla TaxID=7936 RepID=A0A0E9WCY6_ANGAN
MDVFLRPQVGLVPRLDLNHEVIAHVLVRHNGSAVGVRVPGLLVECQRAFGCDHLHKPRDFTL